MKSKFRTRISCSTNATGKRPRKRRQVFPGFRINSLRASRGFNALIVCTFALAMLVAPVPRALASAPSAGSIGPSGPTQIWTGTAAGGAAANESTCVEGVNCDTFTLNVTGTTSDWTDKLVRVRIEWTIPVNDYDLYVHKDSNAGPVVGQSGDGAPETIEETTISPSSTGTGVYTIHVVYFSVTPLVDQYRGTASVESKPTARNANYLKTGIA